MVMAHLAKRQSFYLRQLRLCATAVIWFLDGENYVYTPTSTLLNWFAILFLHCRFNTSAGRNTERSFNKHIDVCLGMSELDHKQSR